MSTRAPKRKTPAPAARKRADKSPGKGSQPYRSVCAATASVVREFELPHPFENAISKEADELAVPPDAQTHEGRTDLRKRQLVTIDGADAKDFDDAVHCRRTKDGFELTVAIADVSHYVRNGTPLDNEAYTRGTSVYLTDLVIPMLPESLSNGICSLKPGEDRLCFACEIEVNKNGEVGRYRFFEAVMHSHKRLIYEDVAAALDSGDDLGLGSLLPDLKALYDSLAKARQRRGALDLEIPETKLQLCPKGKVEITAQLRNVAHMIIEECMLAANICAADYLLRTKQPALFRVHSRPENDKATVLRGVLSSWSIESPKRLPGAGALKEPLSQIARMPPATARSLSMAVLRCMERASYTPKNFGHFGLAYDRYTHFTSPIRRYPDLEVHRALKAAVAGRRHQPHRPLRDVGKHCTDTEARADRASWRAIDILACRHMSDKVGEIFDAAVVGIARFGMFVATDPYNIEGMIRIANVGKDYFHFDEERNRLVGQKTGTVWRIGDMMRVRLTRVAEEEGKLTFEPA